MARKNFTRVSGGGVWERSNNMPLRERVYSVLLISSAQKFNESLLGMLPAQLYNPVRVLNSVNAAQRLIQDQHFDIIVINTPLPDDFGHKFAIDISVKNTCAILLFVKSELYDEINAKVIEYGVFTLRKPAPTLIINQAFDWLRAARERLRALEAKAISLEDKMAEIRLVNHAKWALIDSCNMTERDAHRYIEKQAMDRCVTRLEIAESILRTYS